MIGVKVNICTDLSAGVLMHNVLLPPPIPVPVPSISIEMAVNQDWPPGEFANTHKRAATVQHKGRRIVLEGHDCGPMIPDVTPLFPLNYFYLIMWPFSSRKFTFSASTVQADAAPIGCAALFLPMMTCGDPISAPTGIALSSWTNTVEVGMTGTDLAIGLAYAAASVALDSIFNKIGGASTVRQVRQSVSRAALGATSRQLAQRAASEAGRHVAEQSARRVVAGTLAREAVSKVVGFNDGASAVKRAVSVGIIDPLAGFARAEAANAPNAGDWTVTYSVGVPFANASGSVTNSEDASRRGVSRQTSWLNEQTAVSPTGAVQRTRNSVAVATPVVSAGHRP